MDKNTKISFVIPYYNGFKTPHETALSLWNATHDFYSNIEIIIVDDGSNQKLDFPENKLPIFYYYLDTNKGQSYATAFGILQSTANIIITIDDDIVYSLENINLLITSFLDTNVDVLYAVRSHNKQHSFFRNLISNWIKKILYFLFHDRASSIRVLHAEARSILASKIAQPNFSLDKQLTLSFKNKKYVSLSFESEGKSRYTLSKLLYQIFCYFAYK